MVNSQSNSVYAALLAGQTTLSFVTDSTDCNLFTFTGTGIGFGTLSTARQIAAVADTAVAVDLLQAADVSGNSTAEVTFDEQVILQDLGDLSDLILREIAGHEVAVDTDFSDDFQRLGGSDTVEITQRIFNALVSRNVNTDDSRHDLICPVFMVIVKKLETALLLHQPWHCLWRALREQMTRILP